MPGHSQLVERFHRVLVDEIRRAAPTYLENPFSVAEIYQSLIPYRTHRDRLGIEMNGDYEDVLLRLLAGEGEYLLLESEPARARIRKEMENVNPNTGIYREFAAVGVRLNPGRLPEPEKNGLQASFATFQEDEGPEEPSPLAGPEQLAGSEGEGPSRVEPSQASQKPSSGFERHTATDREGVAASRCPDCQTALPDRDSLRFCPRCGTNVLEVPCSRCGEVLERSWQYCVACGTPAGG